MAVEMEMIRLENDSQGWERAYELYSGAAGKDMLHAAMSPEEFYGKMFPNTKGVRTVNLLEKEGNAFAMGCMDETSGKIFVTMVLVKEQERGKGLGREILGALEGELGKEAGREKITLEISFYNPVAFAWNIPGKRGVAHPNMPGADVGSGEYLFFQNCGFRDFAVQNSYYLNLQDYEAPAALKEKKKRLAKEGLEFAVYDREIHHGMEDMLKALGNPLWEKEILGEPMPKDGGRPVLAPVRDGRVLGFTGPLSVEKSGRGYFAGIAVGEMARGKGVGKVLFGELCRGLKNIGAGYMTLFTGENNPARNIYEDAGFSIVRTFADMRSGAC